MRPSLRSASRRKASILFLLACMLAGLAAPAGAEETIEAQEVRRVQGVQEVRKPARQGGVNVVLAAAGLALLAGGGVYAYLQDREADRDMRVYRRSAFSDNTVDYRERVEEHQKLTWAGLAGAALGGVLLVVSF